MPAAAALLGPRTMHGRRLVAAAGRAQSACCGSAGAQAFYIMKARNLARDHKADQESPADERQER